MVGPTFPHRPTFPPSHTVPPSHLPTTKHKAQHPRTHTVHSPPRTHHTTATWAIHTHHPHCPHAANAPPPPLYFYYHQHPTVAFPICHTAHTDTTLVHPTYAWPFVLRRAGSPFTRGTYTTYLPRRLRTCHVPLACTSCPMSLLSTTQDADCSLVCDGCTRDARRKWGGRARGTLSSAVSATPARLGGSGSFCLCI